MTDLVEYVFWTFGHHPEATGCGLVLVRPPVGEMAPAPCPGPSTPSTCQLTGPWAPSSWALCSPSTSTACPHCHDLVCSCQVASHPSEMSLPVPSDLSLSRAVASVLSLSHSGPQQGLTELTAPAWSPPPALSPRAPLPPALGAGASPSACHSRPVPGPQGHAATLSPLSLTLTPGLGQACWRPPHSNPL